MKIRKKIAAALEELGYQENKLAKVLANGKSEFVGIIIPNLYLHYYSEILNQLLSSYSKFGYNFLSLSAMTEENGSSSISMSFWLIKLRV